ncbi:tRNA1(Val) (adenine(37)-N6)-methyltransferase [Anaerosphaera multitolerans]|uniref:Methyltransferase small domain-containing protein n=1 Tax=Anaerosphaera multitolerans TaxID=2487351 RepID=A0A437S546_9FIRM|nr:methyltransferase [Anaerosphaera multitolerans]RVU54114.1 hypothetical protein EF514_09015 [Anaerosphaera multitolerans]
MNKDFIPGTGYFIYQDDENFKYTTDSLILSSFSRVRGRCVDLGSGNGLLALRLIDRKGVDSFINVEVNKDSYVHSQLSIKENGLSQKIRGLNIDVKNIKEYIDHQSMDSVIMNPPYFSNSLINEKESITQARHSESLEDFIIAAAHILKNSGRLYMVITVSKLVDVFYMLRKRKIEVKRIRFVKKDFNSKAKVVLIEGIKQGRPNLIVERDFITKSDELIKVYENEEI